MNPNALLRTAGKFQFLVFRLPVIGEPLVRGLNRAAAYAAFYAPVFGGKWGASIRDVRDGWLRFLKRAGISPVVTKEDSASFEWVVDQCPYGLCKRDQRGLCDAVMDLDRTYTRLLGGELVIHERIPDGAAKCRYTTRLVH